MNKIQQYKEILEQAPEGATHVEMLTNNLRKQPMFIRHGRGSNWLLWRENKTWGQMPKSGINFFTRIRALSDLQTIVEQAETIERLKITTDNSKVNAELIKENERLKACVAELGRYLDIAERHLHDEHFTYYAEDCEQLTPPECK